MNIPYPRYVACTDQETEKGGVSGTLQPHVTSSICYVRSTTSLLKTLNEEQTTDYTLTSSSVVPCYRSIKATDRINWLHRKQVICYCAVIWYKVTSFRFDFNWLYSQNNGRNTILLILLRQNTATCNCTTHFKIIKNYVKLLTLYFRI